MKSDKTYFALWANDINKYLSTCYNFNSITEVRKGILEYISVDLDNPKDTKHLTILTLLNMTGLELDCNSTKFEYRDILDDEPSLYRTGLKVQDCFLK